VLPAGTDPVPPDGFTLFAGQVVEIHVPDNGTLSNPVVRARDLLARSAQ